MNNYSTELMFKNKILTLFFSFCSTSNTLALDDVRGVEPEVHDISDAAIESERKFYEQFLQGWNHPRSTFEETLFIEDLQRVDLIAA